MFYSSIMRYALYDIHLINTYTGAGNNLLPWSLKIVLILFSCEHAIKLNNELGHFGKFCAKGFI